MWESLSGYPMLFIPQEIMNMILTERLIQMINDINDDKRNIKLSIDCAFPRLPEVCINSFNDNLNDWDYVTCIICRNIIFSRRWRYKKYKKHIRQGKILKCGHAVHLKCMKNKIGSHYDKIEYCNSFNWPCCKYREVKCESRGECRWIIDNSFDGIGPKNNIK